MEEEIKLFNKYFNKYGVISEIKEKKEHSYRVAKYAFKIAKSLNLNVEDTTRVVNASLLHDIGRVPQLYFYSTFNDLKSKDHGDLGYELLMDNKYNNSMVLNAVKNHNKYKISDHLTEIEELICNIVRDADKLDIMFTQNFNIDNDNYFLPDDVYYAFKKNVMVDNQYESTNIISTLRMLGFIFDLNFNQNNIVSKKINLIYDRFNDSRLKDIEFILNEYINNNLEYGRENNYGRIRKKI